jgi:hypothetical protein
MGAESCARLTHASHSPSIDVLKRQQIESPAHPRGESTQSTTSHAIEQRANRGVFPSRMNDGQAV